MYSIQKTSIDPAIAIRFEKFRVVASIFTLHFRLIRSERISEFAEFSQTILLGQKYSSHSDIPLQQFISKPNKKPSANPAEGLIEHLIF